MSRHHLLAFSLVGAMGLSAITGCPAKPTTTTPATTATATTPPPTPPAAPLATDATRAMVQAGQLPPGPEVNIVMSRCVICHAVDHVTQQRLTPAQWDKTIRKMQGWGAPISDEELPRLSQYLSTHFVTGIPDRDAPLVPAPAGAR